MFIDNKLKSLRYKYNLSQRRVAQLLNITVSSYSRKENGQRSFTLDEAYKLAIYFHTTIENIFFSKDVQ